MVDKLKEQQAGSVAGEKWAKAWGVRELMVFMA